MENRDDIRFRRGLIDIPGIPELLEDRRSDIGHQAARFVNYIGGANEDVSVSARDDTPAAKEAAQRVENGFFFMVKDFSSQRSNVVYAADRRADDQQVTKGVGIRHLAFAQEWRSKLFGKQLGSTGGILDALELDEDGFTSNPFVIECPDVEATFWEPDFSIVCEMGVKLISALEALNEEEIGDYLLKYPEGIVSETIQEFDKPNNSVRTFHLETPEFIYDVIDASNGEDGMMLEYRVNAAGRPWYTFTPGNLTSSRNVGEAFEPLLNAIYPLVQKAQIYGTLLGSSAMRTGRFGHQLVAIGAQAISAIDFLSMPTKDRPTVETNLTDEQIAHPPEGFEYKILPVPDQSTLMEMYRDTKQEIQEKGFPPILDPSAVLKAESGYDRNQMGEAATLYLDPPLANKAGAIKELLLLIADVMIGLNESVKDILPNGVSMSLPVLDRAGGGDLKVLRRDTIKGDDWRDIDLRVIFKSIPLAAQATQQEMDSRSEAEGVMSRETRMKRMWDDPEAEEDRINQGRVQAIVAEKNVKDIAALIDKQSPAIQERVLAEEGVLLSDEELAASAEGLPERQRPAGGAGGGGVIPNVGAPGTPPIQSESGQPQLAGTQVEV